LNVYHYVCSLLNVIVNLSVRCLSVLRKHTFVRNFTTVRPSVRPSVCPLYVNAQSYQFKNLVAVFCRLFSLEHCRVIDKKIIFVRPSVRPHVVCPFCVNIRLRVILQQYVRQSVRPSVRCTLMRRIYPEFKYHQFKNSVAVF